MKKLIAALSIWAMFGAVQTAVADEAELAGTAWLVDDIGGRGVVDRARTTLEFLEPGRIRAYGMQSLFRAGRARRRQGHVRQPRHDAHGVHGLIDEPGAAIHRGHEHRQTCRARIRRTDTARLRR